MGRRTQPRVFDLGEARVRRKPFRVGLTGGICAGKTAACQVFEKLGVPVIDADGVAREIVLPTEPAFQEIIDTFGTTVVGRDGLLDREKLRSIVFADPQKRVRLENITHPRIYQIMEKRAAQAAAPYVVLCIPLIVETRQTAFVDQLLVIDVPETLQLKRLMERDRLSTQQARAILDSQASRQARLQAADYVVSNDGDFARLQAQVKEIHAKLLEELDLR